ncbi:MAG: DUF6814 family protein [Chitinophagaceae bacterium]
MNLLRKFLGLVWMILGPLIICVLITTAINTIDINGKSDINKPVPWIIVIAIFTPICVGLSIFGYYAWNKEYERVNDV